MKKNIQKAGTERRENGLKEMKVGISRQDKQHRGKAGDVG